MKKVLFILILFTLKAPFLLGQQKHYYQTDFSKEEFESRRAVLFDAIGVNGIALIQSAPTVAGFKVFRQTNTFYYLSGVEEGHAYLLLDGKTGTKANVDIARKSFGSISGSFVGVYNNEE